MVEIKRAVIVTATVLAVIFIARQFRPVERVIHDALGI